MCLVLIAFKHTPNYPLIIAANRDEFYARPSNEGHFWSEAPELFAGRDLVAGGTWMGVTKGGRFAVVTNFRDPGNQMELIHNILARMSRGELVRQFLESSMTPLEYLRQVDSNKDNFAGFNLIVGTFYQDGVPALLYYSNRRSGISVLTQGIYGLSNGLLDDPWPKVNKGKGALAEVLAHSSDSEMILPVLLDQSVAADHELPDTGVDLNTERLLSSCFIRSKSYGTRNTTVLRFNNRQSIDWLEQSFDAVGCIGGGGGSRSVDSPINRNVGVLFYLTD